MYQVELQKILEEHRLWSDSNGDKPIGKGHFGDSLTERGFAACRYQHGRGRSGIALLIENNEEEENGNN